jgi:hypothetical protein
VTGPVSLKGLLRVDSSASIVTPRSAGIGAQGAIRQATGQGYAFNLSETAPANTENDRDRERPERQRAGGFFVARHSPAFPSRRVLYSDRSTRRTNRGRETMRIIPGLPLIGTRSSRRSRYRQDASQRLRRHRLRPSRRSRDRSGPVKHLHPMSQSRKGRRRATTNK